MRILNVIKLNKLNTLSLLMLVILACNNDTKRDKNLAQKAGHSSKVSVPCDLSLQQLIKRSTLSSPFKKNIRALIESENGEELIVQLLVASDAQRENTVGWISINTAKKTVADITNDIQTPQVLQYQPDDWERFISCHTTSSKITIDTPEGSLLSELFPEGSTIDLTPRELEANPSKYAAFKEKLLLFEKKHKGKGDIKAADLLVLVNNEVFSNSNTFINSAWLKYFLDNYAIDTVELRTIMDRAIQQEDLAAVKILLRHGFITSSQQLDLAAKTRANARQLVKLNKENNGLDEAGDPTFYDDKYSMINDIEQLLLSYYGANVIDDTDGYTNLRQEMSSSSAIIEKVASGAPIKVLDNTHRWYHVESAAGKKGYIYYAKISSLK